MSEEQVEEQKTEEQVPEAEAPEQQQEEPKKNALYESLFDIAQEEEQEGVEVEKKEQPRSLSEAIHESSIEPQAQTEQVEEAVEEKVEEKAEEPEKTEPKKKKVKQVIDPDLPQEYQQNSLTEKAQEEDPDKEFIESLLPEEKEVYELAKYASEKMPEYKGADTTWKSYIQKTKEYINKRLTDDPHVNLSEDQDYKAFIAREKPNFTSVDAKKVEQEMLLEKAEARAREKLKPEIERVRREQELMNLAPIVKEKKSNVNNQVKNIIPKEFRDILDQENGLEVLSKTKPLEYSAIDAVATQAISSSNLLIDITSGAVTYDPSNTDHQSLLNWVNQEQDNFINSGQTSKDGKVFMRRERFFQLPESKRSEYYTWTDDDLVGIIMNRSQQAMETALQKQKEMLAIYLQSQGQAPQPAQPKQVEPKPKPPSIASSPRPAPTEKAAEQPQNPLFTALGM